MKSPKIELRERGIYRVPNGTRVVACLSDDRYVFYRVQEWERCEPRDRQECASARIRQYLTAVAAGRLFQMGKPTKWRLKDLEDTGETATVVKSRAIGEV